MIFNLRKATDQDLDLTFKIKQNALQEYLEMLWGWNEKAQKDFHKKEYKKEHFQVIELQNEPIGYLEIEPFQEHIFLANLMILQQFQGKGLGKIIMQDLIKNRPMRTPGEEGLKDMKIMAAVFEAAKTGKEVKIS